MSLSDVREFLIFPCDYLDVAGVRITVDPRLVDGVLLTVSTAHVEPPGVSHYMGSLAALEREDSSATGETGD